MLAGTVKFDANEPLDGEIGQERVDLGLSHVLRMTLAMEEDALPRFAGEGEPPPLAIRSALFNPPFPNGKGEVCQERHLASQIAFISRK